MKLFLTNTIKNFIMKMRFTAIHPVKGKRVTCYCKNGYVIFAGGWRKWVQRKFPSSEVTGLLPAK
jgi:hypothetical protein